MTAFGIEGFGTLRPWNDDDLTQVLAWRNRAEVRANMYTQHEISMQEHKDWWVRKKGRSDELYFIFEALGHPLGVVSFSEIQKSAGTAFWAFYAAADAPKGTGSRMEFLALEYHFVQQRMRKLNCEVLAFNMPVLSLHQKFGFEQEGCFREHVMAGGKLTDVHRLALFNDIWQSKRAEMKSMIMQKAPM